MRKRVVHFACWLFGHELLVFENDRDIQCCECGARCATGTAIASVRGGIGRAWHL